MKITFADKAALEAALANALLFASKERNRPILCASKLEVDGDELKIVSTDSYILAVEELTVKAEKDVPESFLIDRDYITEMLRLVKGTPAGDLILTLESFGSDRHRFTFANELGSQCAGVCLDADYPNWKQLLPTTAPVRTTEYVNLAQKYLGLIAKVKVAGNRGGMPVVLNLPESNLKPVAWKVGAAIHGILMPVRCA